MISFCRCKPSGLQYEPDIISIWIVYKHHLFEETRLICNMFYSVRKEGYQLLDIKDESLTAEILGKVCKNVVIEPLLTSLMGKSFLNLQIQVTKQEQMYQLEVCGLTSKRPFVT